MTRKLATKDSCATGSSRLGYVKRKSLTIPSDVVTRNKQIIKGIKGKLNPTRIALNRVKYCTDN